MERQERIKDWLDSVYSDCRSAFRQLRKTPGFTAIVVLTLAFGVGANTAVFSICSAVLIRALPYPHAERLVKADVYDLKSGEAYGETSYPDFTDWSEQNHFFEHLAAYESKTFNLSRLKQPEHVKGEVVSSDFFETLGIRPFLGRTFAGERNQQAVVLSHSLWSRAFGSDPGAIGRSIALDGYSYEVIGVMPRSFQYPDLESELWASITPARPDLREEIAARGNLGFLSSVCLTPTSPCLRRKRGWMQLQAASNRSIQNQIETSECDSYRCKKTWWENFDQRCLF
jgi:putative ABC transport system permease protein